MHDKAIKNLHSYKCNAVVANMLQNYKDHVYVYLRDAAHPNEPIYIKREADHTIEEQMADLFIAQVSK